MRDKRRKGKWDPDCFLWALKFSQAFSIILIYFLLLLALLVIMDWLVGCSRAWANIVFIKWNCQSVELIEGFKLLNVLGAQNYCTQSRNRTETKWNTFPAKLSCRQLSEEHFCALSVSERWRQLEGQNVRSALTIMSLQLLDIFSPKGQSFVPVQVEKSNQILALLISWKSLHPWGIYSLSPSLHLDLMITLLKNKNQLHAESTGDSVVIFCFFSPFCWSGCKMGQKMEDNLHRQSMNLVPYYI